MELIKCVLLISLFGVVVLSSVLASRDLDLDRLAELQGSADSGEAITTLFDDFKTIFNKHYRDSKEEDTRKQIFGENVEFIVKHNEKHAKGAETYTLGINQFTDLTHHEFRHGRRTPSVPSSWFNSRLNYSHVVARQKREDDDSGCYISKGNVAGGTPYRPTPGLSAPAAVDWRTSNRVTNVTNQGDCGACWAFSAVGSLEGQVAKKTGKLVSLSVQELVDCAQNNGCGEDGGGDQRYAFKYIQKAGGLASEDTYSYTATKETCKNRAHVIGTRISHYGFTKPGDETELKKAVAEIGPISASLDFSAPEFDHYSSGVLTTRTCGSNINDLDHAILIVGYGTERGEDYWLIKNSHGSSWGQGGYLKLRRNMNNMCGVASEPTYPVMYSSKSRPAPNSADTVRQSGWACCLVVALLLLLIF